MQAPWVVEVGRGPARAGDYNGSTMHAAGDRETSGLLQIGAFARLASTNLRTLRYYEELGLLQPAARSPGGFRFYRAEDVHRLNLVHTLQALGLELGRIRDLVCTRREGSTHAEFLARVRAALAEERRLIDERVAELHARGERIERAVLKLGDCETCGFHPAAQNNFCQPCQLDGTELPEDLSALF